MPRPDSSASPERTRFAWRRTSLVATVVMILLVRLAVQERNLAVAALAALCWVMVLVAIQRRVHALAGPVVLRGTGLLWLMAATAVTFALLGLALLLP